MLRWKRWRGTLYKSKRIMDNRWTIEWGKDGQDKNLYILQARPETVKSRERGVNLERYELTARGEVLVTGRSVGQKVGSGDRTAHIGSVANGIHTRG